ncbi:MAG: hypothetical protein CFE21_13375 [Bacteroidetes bacterium B1(2017)]|nr:MAG: hypothetical protein CFE21_13375 [Bacteroidetes bacterium B1(2017)]
MDLPDENKEDKIFYLEERIVELEKENQALKENQIEISKAKELYLKIFEDFPALIWRSRTDKLCDHFNKTWLDFTGRTMEQEFGNGWAEGVHPDDFERCLEIYVTEFDKRKAFAMDYRMLNRQGEYRWIRDYGRPFYDVDNTFLGYIGSCYDITENKDYELKLVDLNNEKDKFFSIIGHDLKGPISSVIALSEILSDYIESKEFEKLNEIGNNIKELSINSLEILKDLFDWAQSQSGRMKFNPAQFNLSELVSEGINHSKPISILKSITIENNFPELCEVYADKKMIQIVLRNLLSNAIKFTPLNGTIVVSVSILNSEIILSVKDNGVGISTERINRLFNLNDGQSTNGTMKEKGTGLGLVLCKDLIEKNNGKIWVESEQNNGSSFYFTLPQNQ